MRQAVSSMSESVSWPRAVVVSVVLVLVTFMGYTEHLDPAVVSATYTSAIGYAMGYINGKKSEGNSKA